MLNDWVYMADFLFILTIKVNVRPGYDLEENVVVYCSDMSFHSSANI